MVLNCWLLWESLINTLRNHITIFNTHSFFHQFRCQRPLLCPISLKTFQKKFSKTNKWQEYKWFFFISKTDANEYKSNYRHINLVSLFHFCWLYLSTTRFASLRTKTSQANHKLRYIKISKFFNGALNKCMIIIGIRMMVKDHVHLCFLSTSLRS